MSDVTDAKRREAAELLTERVADLVHGQAMRGPWLDVQGSYEVMAKLIAGSQSVTGGRAPTLKDLRVAAQALKTDAAWLMKIITDLEAAAALEIA